MWTVSGFGRGIQTNTPNGWESRGHGRSVGCLPQNLCWETERHAGSCFPAVKVSRVPTGGDPSHAARQGRSSGSEGAREGGIQREVRVQGAGGWTGGGSTVEGGEGRGAGGRGGGTPLRSGGGHGRGGVREGSVFKFMTPHDLQRFGRLNDTQMECKVL